MTKQEPEKVQVETAAELRQWLQQNHKQANSIWLVTWKKDSGKPSVKYDDIVDECICFGWIDSLPRKLDDNRSMIRLSPRNPKSNWSAVNKRRVTKLLKQKKITAAGKKVIEAAKASGAYNFLDDVERLEIPPDLAAALNKKPKAKRYFERFPPSSKRGILEWIKTAKTDSTRARRIDETVTKAVNNRKANHPAGRDQGPKQ